MHGFDEFFGNLYHLNAEEEPELRRLPDRAEDFPRLQRAASARAGCSTRWATDDDDDTVDARYGRVGKQRIEDTGPLTKKRMETIDDETVAAAIDFISRQHAADTPFFVLDEHHAHALRAPTPSRRASGRPAAGSRRTTTR